MKKRIAGFVLGSIVGATLGLLFAPRAGEETRKMIADTLDEKREQAKDLGAQVSEDFQQASEEIAGAARTVATEAASVPADDDAELRERIDAARERIAQQIAKNAEATAETGLGA